MNVNLGTLRVREAVTAGPPLSRTADSAPTLGAADMADFLSVGPAVGGEMLIVPIAFWQVGLMGSRSMQFHATDVSLTPPRGP